MPESPAISVVVPLYNEEDNVVAMQRELSEALAGIDYELVLVDDGSTDNTAAVLADYQARHAALQVISQVNAGAAAARNPGSRGAGLRSCPR